jgi:hypothetical protein
MAGIEDTGLQDSGDDTHRVIEQLKKHANGSVYVHRQIVDPLYNPDRWIAHLRVDKRIGDWSMAAINAGDASLPYEVVDAYHNIVTQIGATALFTALTQPSGPPGGFYTATTGVTTNLSVSNSSLASLAVGDGGMSSATVLSTDAAGRTTPSQADADVAAGAYYQGFDHSTNYFIGNGGAATAPSWASNIATFNTASLPQGTVAQNHNFQVGQLVTVRGLTPSGHQGWDITAPLLSASANTFTVAMPYNPGTVTVGAAAQVTSGAMLGASTLVTTAASQAFTITLTLPAWAQNGGCVGMVAQCFGNSQVSYNGTWLVTASSTSTITVASHTAAGTPGTAFSQIILFSKVRAQTGGTGNGAISGATSTYAGQLVLTATFGPAMANMPWNSWGVDNSGASGNVWVQAPANLLNHAIPGLGTKANVNTWTLTALLSLS